MAVEGVSLQARLMIEALECGDWEEFNRLKEYADLPKDDPVPRKSCDFHFAPEK